MTAVLLWKEYRQQRAVWLAIVFLAIILVVSLATTLGQGSGWQVFQDERLRDSLTLVVVCLSVAFGIVSGALLLAGESDEGTIGFLDNLLARRGPLWAVKVLAGVLLTLSLTLTLAALAMGVGFAPWYMVLLLPLLGMDALAWGLLGGALCRRVLTAVFAAIGLLATSCLFLVPWENAPLLMVGQAVMTTAAVYGSWRIFCRLDRERLVPVARPQRKAVTRFPAGRVLVWLAFRQGRWLLTACLLGALLLGFIIHGAPLVLWPMGTLLLGLVCGLSVFVHDQNEGVRFLGAQRFPAGRIWTVKLLFWGGVLFALTTLTWAVDIGGGVTLFPSSRFPNESRGYHWYDELGQRAELISSFVFFGLWPLYGFCFGQFFAQILRRPVLAVILAVFVTPLVVALWIPSLLFGGVPFWQLLILPVVLLSLTRLSQRAWLSGRLFTVRPLVIIGGGVALTIVALIGCFWYRAVEVPELDEPFDVPAYLATLPTPEQNEAGLLVRQAGTDLQEYRSKVEQELGPPKEPIFPKVGGDPGVPQPAPGVPPLVPAMPPPVPGVPQPVPGVPQPVPAMAQPVGANPPLPLPRPPGVGPSVSAEYTYNEFLYEICEAGWPKQEKELGRWLDRLFQGEWVQEAQKAAHLPLGVVADPRLADAWGQFGSLSRDCSSMAQLFTARALQLQAHGDSRTALDLLETALGLSRQFRNAAPAVPYQNGTVMETIALSGMRIWMQNLGPNKELLRAALTILKVHEAALPGPVNTIKSQYLLDRKREAPIDRHTTFVDDLLAFASQVPWEKERQLRLSRALTRAGASLELREAQQPVWKTISRSKSHSNEDGNFDPRLATQLGLPPKAGPGANLSAEQWGDWIEQSDLGERGNWYYNATVIIFGRSQRDVSVGLLVAATALYQVEHGKAPDQLEDLVPTYLTELPVDPFNGKPFGYRISKGEKIEWETSPIILVPGQALIFTEHSNHLGYYPVPIWNKWFRAVQ